MHQNFITLVCSPLRNLKKGKYGPCFAAAVLKTKALLAMKDRFVDDPYPCIELSTLYHEKKAYRKAETILEEAAGRAPADSRVMDRRVLSLLIAADRS